MASEDESANIHFKESTEKLFLKEFEPHENKRSDVDMSQAESDYEMLLTFYYEQEEPNEHVPRGLMPSKQAYLFKKRGHAQLESKYVHAEFLDSTLIFSFWLQWSKKKQMLDEMVENEEELNETWIANREQIEQLNAFLREMERHHVQIEWGRCHFKVIPACRIWIERIVQGRGDRDTFSVITNEEINNQLPNSYSEQGRGAYESFSSIIKESFGNIGVLPF